MLTAINSVGKCLVHFCKNMGEKTESAYFQHHPQKLYEDTWMILVTTINLPLVWIKYFLIEMNSNENLPAWHNLNTPKQTGTKFIYSKDWCGKTDCQCMTTFRFKMIYFPLFPPLISYNKYFYFNSASACLTLTYVWLFETFKYDKKENKEMYSPTLYQCSKMNNSHLIKNIYFFLFKFT